MSREYHYFPGCSLHGAARAYDTSLRDVVRVLGVKLHELDGWNCCGATAARSLSRSLPLVLAARNLALVRNGGSLLVPCNLCYNNLATARQLLQDEDLRKRVNSHLKHLGLACPARTPVVHPLQALMSDVGLNHIASRVTNPLTGIKVVCYYGCLLTRPREVSIPESNFNPVWLDDLARASGASVLPFSSKTRCCGGPQLMTHPEAARLASKRILDEARDLGARCIVVTCPMCHVSLHSSQASQRDGRSCRRVLVLYFTQLLGLALGIAPSQLGLYSSWAGSLMISRSRS